MSEPLLELHGVDCGYPGHPVVSDAGLKLYPGERVALVGANGAGKSTLLRLLVGLHRPARGSVVAFGAPCSDEAAFRRVRGRVGLLFQDPEDQLFCPTVLEEVCFGPLNLGRAPSEALAVARAMLASLGLAGLARRITHRLSGGEKRLVALAAVLAMEPEVLLLDEPTNALDAQAERRLVDYLAALPQAMLIVSHDTRLVERLATRALLLEEGRLRDAVLHRHPHVHSHLHVHANGHAAGHVHTEDAPPHAHPHIE